MNHVMASQFLKSAADFSGLPDTGDPEVVLAGRSNAGKSSLLNALVGQAAARVSKTPGKTTLLNFFLVSERDLPQKMVLVDTPGYGYAKRSKEERKAWAPMIEEYLKSGPNLRGVVLICDSQRPLTYHETDLITWLAKHDRPVILVANKIDRLNQKERSALKKDWRQELENIEGVVDVVGTSARTKEGIDDLKRSVFEKLIKV